MHTELLGVLILCSHSTTVPDVLRATCYMCTVLYQPGTVVLRHSEVTITLLRNVIVHLGYSTRSWSNALVLHYKLLGVQLYYVIPY